MLPLHAGDRKVRVFHTMPPAGGQQINKPELDRESEREKKHRRSSWDLFRSVGHGVKDEEDLPDVCFQSFSFGVTDVERHDLLPLFPSHTLLRKRQKTERV